MLSWKALPLTSGRSLESSLGERCDWDPDDSELRQMIWAMFSSPMTTKSTLESAFSHLRDKGQRHSRNDKMSSETRCSYLATQPYARDDVVHGVQQVKTTADDFSVMARNQPARTDILTLKLYAPRCTRMPGTYSHPQDIARKIMPTGLQRQPWP